MAELSAAAPVAPMLARPTRTLPRERHLYEPKWDGFRCLAAADAGEITLWSRHGRPFARYFPELVAALAALKPGRWLLDGEILARGVMAKPADGSRPRRRPSPTRRPAFSTGSGATETSTRRRRAGSPALAARPRTPAGLMRVRGPRLG